VAGFGQKFLNDKADFHELLQVRGLGDKSADAGAFDTVFATSVTLAVTDASGDQFWVEIRGFLM
jgi:hypothetical protein